MTTESRTESRTTFCRICESLCGMVADVEDGRLVRLRPDKEHPMSAGFACQKGIAFTEVVNDPDRVTAPLRRQPDGTFAEVSWDEALGDIAKRLSAIHREHGSGGSRVVLRQPGCLQLIAHDGRGVLRQRSGPGPHLYTASSQDHPQPVNGQSVALRHPRDDPDPGPDPE